MKGIFINIFNKFLTTRFKKIMKKTTTIFSVLAILIIVFNITLIDFNEFFSKKNTVVLITIIAGACCLLLLQILRILNKIKNYKNKNN